MAVYQQYGTGTKTETKKKKSDDDGVDVGTKNTNSNTNSNRSGSVVALMSTLVAVVLMVIVLYVQASASFSSTAAFEDVNLLRSGTGTNTVIIDDSAAAGVVAAPPLPPMIGDLLASFILSYDSSYSYCVDRLTHKDVPWKNACKCLVDTKLSCSNQFQACTQCYPPSYCPISDCQHRAAEIFSSCDKHEEDFDYDEYEICANTHKHHNRNFVVEELVDCVFDHQRLGYCFIHYPPSSS